MLNNRNLRSRRNPHQNQTVRNTPKALTIALLCGMAFCPCWAKDGATAKPSGAAGRALNSHERKAVVAVALDSKGPSHAERDCSHFVHGIYENAGFPYVYAPSDDLYEGIAGFQRVSKPKPADLIVWRGHVGIVIRPAQHAFFSFLTSGPGIGIYNNRYWTSRGHPRFYRYLKN
jgi:cell wall-associated NlpC family hydrolase